MGRVFFLDQFALELHGRCQFFVFGAQLGVQQPEFLDLLNAGKFFVDPVHFGLDQVLHFSTVCEAGVVGERHVVVLCVFLGVLLVDHDDHCQVRPLVADDDRVRDIGREFQFVFQFAGGDVFATSRDDDVFHPVGDAEKPLLVDHAHIARVQPAVGIDGLGGFFRQVEVTHEHIRAAH